MRIATSTTFSAILLLSGCASYTATINEVSPRDAGAEPDANDDTGGAGSTGGSSSTGGGAATAGATSTGGNSTAGGASPTGGSSNIGGASSTGGASACTKDADCVNPDPINCSLTCVNPGSSGVCKPSALLTPTQCATTACDDKPISGFWDSQGKPHIAFAWTETDGTASIRMQQLKLDGSLDGAAVPYLLPAGQQEPVLVSANAQGSIVGLIWVSSLPISAAQDASITDFAMTDTLGKSSTPAELSNSVSEGENWLQLQVTPAGAWLALGIYANPIVSYWTASSGSSIAAWSSLSPLVYEGEFASGVVGNTLMLTGSDCPSVSGCQPTFKLQRFSVTNLSSIGSFISLSEKFQANEFPAMGPVNGQMALLWTETQSPGELFRALITEDGAFALAIGTTQSAIQPKAIVQSADGGGLLIGTIPTGSPIMYQLVGQRLDANLAFVGSPIPLADSENSDATNFETYLAADGRQVLITYRQAGARYRLLATNFCGA